MLQIAGIVIAFIVIIIMVNKKISLGYALVSGSLIVGFFSGLGVMGIIDSFIAASIDPITIRLVAILGLISILGYLMQEFGILRKVVDSLNALLKTPKLTLSIVPSIMGTLLVTGGAIMAAPLVDEIGDDLNLEKSKKAAINLVFRHGWYFIYPMMPGFILVSEIAKIDKFDLISIQWPLTVVILAIGYIMWIRPSKVNENLSYQNGKRSLSDLTKFVKYSSPIWVSLVIALGLEGVRFGSLSASANSLLTNIAFPIGLVIGIALTFFLSESSDNMAKEFLNGINISIMFSGLGIMIFKEMVGQLSVLNDVVLSFLDSGVPIYILFITLPLVTGLLSASTTSAIGVTLPILLPALSVSANPVPLIMLAYSSSFLGYLVSPLHLCQILTLEYFKVKISDLYREYTVAIPATFIASIVLYFIVR
ncbi:MAG: DUF401 family protein [Clostridia bacterium]